MSEVKDIEEKIEIEEINRNDGEDFKFGTLKDLIGREDEYNEILYMEDGNLVYIADKVDEKQAEWLEEMGITAKQNIIPIYTAEQFKKIGSNEEIIIEEAGGETYKFNADSHYVLQNDINLNCSSENQWVPLGNESNNFKGILDGKNHKISGIYVEGDKIGLFDYNSGTIKNIILTDGHIEGANLVAGITVYNNKEVINCKNEVEIKTTGNNAGGIVALNRQGALIEDCENNAYLNLNANAGGICGQNQGGTIRKCKNTHEILLKDYTLGGIVGNNTANSTVQECYNIGNILANNGYSRYGRGGISGANSGTIRYCFNKGTINSYGSSWSIGGIVGGNTSTGIVEFSYSVGQVVKGNSDNGSIAGGNKEGGIIRNCYAIENDNLEIEGSGLGTIENCLELSDEQMKNKEKITLEDNTQTDIISLLNAEEEKYKEDTKNENNGYPIFK